MFLGKSVLKICSKFTGEHPGQRVISIKWLCNFIEIARGHESSPVHLWRAASEKKIAKTSLLYIIKISKRK